MSKKRLNLDLDRALHDRLKSRSAAAGKTITEFVTPLIEKATRKPKTIKP